MYTAKLISPITMWSLVLIGILISFLIIPNKIILETTIWSRLTLITAIIIWLYLILSALKTHRQAIASVDAINYLVTGGIYNIIRHPMYVGDIILGWGIFFFWPTQPVLASALWLTLILSVWMKLEEKALLKKFGIEYENYILRVPMIIPSKRKNNR